MDAETIRDIFRGLGLIHIRRMFGGQGVYQGELMFALEISGELYLKADDAESTAFFRDLGSRPFSYRTRNGRTTALSFWLMPDSALDDPDEAAQLAALALSAARRVKAAAARKSYKAAVGKKGGKAAPKPAT